MVVVADVVGAQDVQSFGGLGEGPCKVSLCDFLFRVAEVAQARAAADHSVIQEKLEENQKSDAQVEGEVKLPLELRHYARKEVETH
jgi:alpha-D-ribose 1-methylphosphonate 5-phosphate C-P lyase